MLARVATFAVEGVEGREVTVEVDVRRGLPAFSLVGLPDASVREARERVRAALLNSELDFPQQRLTANLAPAAVRKAGPAFDLAIAVGVLAASGQVPADALEGTAVCGELSLGGELRPVRGMLAAALGAHARGYARMIVPEANAGEAALASGVEVLGAGVAARRSSTCCTAGGSPSRRGPVAAERRATRDAAGPRRRARPGRRQAGARDRRRGRPQPADGGPAGRRQDDGGPAAARDPAAAVVRGGARDHADPQRRRRGRRALWRPSGRSARRTTRSPPRAWSEADRRPKPGEMTLAHRGVLFLDELAEFSRAALEALRQPLEDGVVEIVRGQRALSFPTRAMLIAACNPCPCGEPKGECTCREIDRERYQRRLSGPLLDRIDLLCRVSTPAAVELVVPGRAGGEASAAIASAGRGGAGAPARAAGRERGALQRGDGRPAHPAPGRARRRGGGAAAGLRRSGRAHRARSRPGAAAGAHDRRPGGPRPR